MSLIPCSSCGQRVVEKLSQVTWAWQRADRVRVAYRQRLCLACYVANVLGLDVEWMPGQPVTCPACHINSEDDMDPVYATAYVPGSGKLQYELGLCGPCAVEIRNRAMAGAEFLPDRPGGGVSGAPDTGSRTDAWSQLGITRRE